MTTLRMFTIGTLLAMAATAATAANEPSDPTIGVTPKRPQAAAVERVPPRMPVEITVMLPTDMPEAEIDYHLAPLGNLPSQ